MNRKRLTKNCNFLIAGVLLAAIGTFGFLELNHYPKVKKSARGICHTKNSPYYRQTVAFNSFWSIEDCLQEGGRSPERNKRKLAEVEHEG